MRVRAGFCFGKKCKAFRSPRVLEQNLQRDNSFERNYESEGKLI
jgi:hypothetical protein